MRLALVISTLHAGGAERALASLADGFVKAGDEVLLVTLASLPASDFFRLDPRVERRGIGEAAASTNLLAGLGANLARVLRLRALLAGWRPDCIISFGDQTNVVATLAARLAGRRVIVSERTNPEAHRIGRHWEALRRFAYARADAVVFQTRDVAERFCRRTPVKAVVIGNPIAREFIDAPVATGVPAIDGRMRLVAMGRLSYEKGFDLLLAAFSRVFRDHADWDLWIFGEGGERAALEAEVQRRGMVGRVHLPGRTESPASELARSQVFVLPSRFEGMPNAMLEAMALGLPVVAFDCRAGPRELSGNGAAALLVPPADVAQLAAALSRVMSDAQLRTSLGAQAMRVRVDHHPDRVAACWREIAAAPE